MLERQHERATGSANLIPRVDRHNDEQRTDVEHQNTHRHGVNRTRNRFLRIFRFTGGNPDNFDPTISKHHHLQRHHHPKPAVTEEAAVAPQVMNTGRLPAVANPPDDDAETGDNHDDDGGDFKEREPEFQLTEYLHAHQVYGANDQHHAQYPNPVRHRREPDTHIDTKSGHIGDGDNKDFKAVGPAGNVTCQRAEVFLRITRERAGGRVMYRHFPQRTHNDIRRDTTDNIGQQHARTGHFDGVCRTVKQPGANC